MKSPRPSKNQRVSKPRQRKQQHLLEVTVRRDIARVQRNRAIFGFVCKTILIVGACVGIYLGGKEGLRRFLWENPDYYLTEITAPHGGALTREQILAVTGIVEGINIFTIDLAEARAALDQLPQVERAEIQRILPNRINVNITERRPIAWVARRADEDPTVSEKALLIDARGVVMRSKRMLPEYLHLPVISGVAVEDFAPGQKVRSFEMQAALDLVRLTSDNNRFQARNLDLGKGYCVVVTDQQRRKITFGLDRVDLQIERLMRYFDAPEAAGREIQTVNLLVERNTPVTFAEPVAADLDEPATPHAPSEMASPKVKRAEPVATPAPSRRSAPGKSSSPSNRKRSPAEPVTKPFFNKYG